MPPTVDASHPQSSGDSLRDHGITPVTVVAILPVVGTALAMVILFFSVGRSPLPNTATLVHGVANLLVGVALYSRLSARHRRAVFRYAWPTGREVLAAIGLAVVGVAVVAPVAVRAASAVGVGGGPSVPTIDGPFGAVVVTIVSVVIAP